MDSSEDRPALGRVASTAVIWPIAGLLGGLLVGVIRARARGLMELDLLSCVIRWTVTGFFTGLGSVFLLALPIRRRRAISIGRLMAVVAVAGIVAWFFARVLFDAIGYEGF